MADVKKLRPSKKWDLLAPKVLIIVSVLEKALKNARAMASGYILDNLDERFAGTKQKGGYKFGGDGMGTSGTITWVRPRKRLQDRRRGSIRHMVRRTRDLRSWRSHDRNVPRSI